jgi:hypothetical protein
LTSDENIFARLRVDEVARWISAKKFSSQIVSYGSAAMAGCLQSACSTFTYIFVGCHIPEHSHDLMVPDIFYGIPEQVSNDEIRSLERFAWSDIAIAQYFHLYFCRIADERRGIVCVRDLFAGSAQSIVDF